MDADINRENMKGNRLFTESQNISLKDRLLITKGKSNNFAVEKQNYNCSEHF